jgi:hypothetical protein
MARPTLFEVRKVIEYLLRNGSEEIVPRTLAWCTGKIESEVYYREVEKYVKGLKRGKATKEIETDEIERRIQ